MNRLVAIATIVAAGLLSGCAAGMTRTPVAGFLYTDAKAGEGGSGEVQTSKSGRACATSILGLVGTGDASIAEAARQGNIRNISHVDSETKVILGLWAEYCTVVRGE